MGLKECKGLINGDRNLGAGADQYRSIMKTCGELAGLTNRTDPRPGERGCHAMVAELRDPRGMCHSSHETCWPG